jgi:hypothetical protein
MLRPKGANASSIAFASALICPALIDIRSLSIVEMRSLPHSSDSAFTVAR